MEQIKISINGEVRHIAANTNIAQLLVEIGNAEQGVALAVNQAIIARSEWPAHIINHGDEISLFQAIAGG
ncbi:sulfur carrier protein ThiS [Motilimonas pumila]|uniref:Sulfur carrier protein ThiS n=1 Tax=Motilimonas pumila TaxID=2303987 RepID=A0A418YH48_9GAMM|nr:sulfur carrier protein ThiS [Motilimonas pumila]RJG49422.1 sulfur carrier protein ThiS [Motilimonas pumila]